MFLGTGYGELFREIIEMSNETIPNPLNLLPDTTPRKVILYCLNELHLSAEDAMRVLYDASKLMQAIDLLLNGRALSDD